MANSTSNAVAGAQAPLPLKDKSDAKGGIDFIFFITDSWLFKNFILLCIILNAIALGVDAHFGESNPWHAMIEEADTIFLSIFTAELILEFLAVGPRRYFRNGWNIFDVLVVGASYISAMPFISALRTLRILRVLRLVSAVPQMRRVVEALLGAMPGILATVAILGIVYYIGAVMATTLFGATHPELFGGLDHSALVLFQLTLFDDWGNIVNEMGQTYPWAWAFFLGFTVISAFAVLNLFIGVIVDAVQETRNAEIKEDVSEIQEDVSDIEEDVEDIAEAQEDAAVLQRRILEELTALRGEVAAMRAGQASQTAAE